MGVTISQSFTNLIPKSLILAMFIGLVGCQDKKTASTDAQPQTPLSKDQIPQSTILTIKGREIRTRLAISPEQTVRGLSGVKSEDFSSDESMFFYFPGESMRNFWMPDTHFNLDIIFVDSQLKILDIHRNLQHYPHKYNGSNYFQIPRSKKVVARFVIEMRADSPISKSLAIGDQFTWKGRPSLSQIESSIRR